MGAVMFKRLIIESEETGLPISKILAYSSKPCEKCVNTNVVAFNREGDQVNVKRGILSQHMPEHTGTSIIQQAKENRNRNNK